MEQQQTIKNSFSLTGIGMHSGKNEAVTVLPAEPGTGIVFKAKNALIPAIIDYAEKGENKTSLKKEGAEVDTVEHLLAAAYALGIDNLIVEVSGGEIPILDGSALPFFVSFKKAGLVALSPAKKILKILAPVTLEEDKSESLLVVAPLDRLRLSFVLDWPVIGSQFFSFDSAKGAFEKEIAPARTFGLAEDLEKLREKGLAKGASLETALAIGKDGYINRPRFTNEPVRHKILDLMGDLALLGRKLQGQVIGIKSGHALNLELIERLEGIYE